MIHLDLNFIAYFMIGRKTNVESPNCNQAKTLAKGKIKYFQLEKNSTICRTVNDLKKSQCKQQPRRNIIDD